MASTKKWQNSANRKLSKSCEPPSDGIVHQWLPGYRYAGNAEAIQSACTHDTGINEILLFSLKKFYLGLSGNLLFPGSTGSMRGSVEKYPIPLGNSRVMVKFFVAWGELTESCGIAMLKSWDGYQ